MLLSSNSYNLMTVTLQQHRRGKFQNGKRSNLETNWPITNIWPSNSKYEETSDVSKAFTMAENSTNYLHAQNINLKITQPSNFCRTYNYVPWSMLQRNKWSLNVWSPPANWEKNVYSDMVVAKRCINLYCGISMNRKYYMIRGNMQSICMACIHPIYKIFELVIFILPYNIYRERTDTIRYIYMVLSF